MSAGTKNRRRYSRVVLGVETPVATEVLGGEVHAHGLLTVLSVGGGCVEVGQTVPVGTEVELRFTLPESDQEIVCSGIVRHELPERAIGLEFTKFAPGDQERIKEAVQTWLAQDRALASQPG